MLISRTPLRISIGGGGTDLPSYYQRFGGFFISAAIDKHIFVAINKTFRDDYFLKYSALERANTIDEIEHPIIREALRLHEIGPAVEIVSLADIPAGTGLGSSGSFTVGLLNALYAYRLESPEKSELAEQACHIEMNLLGRPVGKQDQYIAAFGGLSCFEIDVDGRVSAKRLAMEPEALDDLEDHLLMFFTGYSRSSGEMLEDQRTRSSRDDPAMLDNLHFIKDLGLRIKDTLEGGDIHGFGELMHEHWLHKRKRSKGMSNPASTAGMKPAERTAPSAEN
ncbi:MAG: galactokinase [Bryobacterales bacterium]